MNARLVALAMLVTATAAAQPVEVDRSKLPKIPKVPKVPPGAGSPGTPATPAGDPPFTARPAGPEPTGLGGFVKFVDPTTHREHANVWWDESGNRWREPWIGGLTAYFRATSGGPAIAIKIDEGFIARLIPEGSTAQYGRTATYAAMAWNIAFDLDRAYTGAPAYATSSGHLHYNPTTHTFLGVDFTKATIGIECPAAWSCKVRVPLAPHVPWPGL